MPLFLQEALANYPRVASVAPSSRHLARAMSEPLRHMKAGVVVELGAGTGVITRALLNLLPKDATLLAFEINPKFCQHLRMIFHDPRLMLIDESAETLPSHLENLGHERVDAVVSSLSFGMMSEDLRYSILKSVLSCMDEKSVFLQYHYLPARLAYAFPQPRKNGRPDILQLMHQHFASVDTRIVWRNLPPAFVYACERKHAAARLD